MMKAIQCQQCGSAMKETTKADDPGCLGWLLGFIGLVSLFIFPVGTIFGAILILLVIFAFKKKVWQCSNCGYFFERAG